MKRLLSLLLACCLILASFPLSASAAYLPFSDVASNAWYRNAVEYVYQHGVMNGKSRVAFEPESNLLRAEMCQILYNLEGQSEVRGSYFWDVSRSDWYFEAVNWAFEKGIVSGKDRGNFDPESPVTREQMVRILFNYAEYMGYDTSSRASLSRYVDASRISSYAVSSVQWAVSQGILSGTSQTAISPTGTAIRAQVASVLMKFLENLSNPPEEPEQPGELDSVEYEIQRKDHSYRNASGQVMIQAFYDLVVLKGDSPAIQKINEAIEVDYQEYVSETTQAISWAKDDAHLTSDYHTTASASVNRNSGGILSIGIGTSWMMGGVHNVNSYALTFNLKTGESAVLPDLFPDMSKASLERLVKEEVKTYIKENPNRSWFDDAEETVDAYDIDEMKYVIQGSKVFVLFDTYELAPGMSGPVRVELSLTLSP